MPDDRKAVEGAIDYAVLQGGAAPTSRIGAAGWIQGVGYDWLTGRINSGSSLGAEGSILNKLIQAGFGGTFIVPFNDKGSGEVDLVPLVGTGSATFTRATTATTVNSAGTIISVASGTPRSYYDPTTLQYLGYLSEGARTNICLRSQEFDNASWTPGNLLGGVVSPNTAVAPDGTTTADSMIESTTVTVQKSLLQIITLTAATYTWTVYAKPVGSTRWLALYPQGTGVAANAVFQLSGAGSVTSTGLAQYLSSSIQALPNGWYRCSLTFTGAAVAVNHVLYISNASGSAAPAYTGDGVSGFYLWGSQVELGSFASSYIPTTTASVPRNADVLTYPSSGNVSGTAGSCYAELTFPQAAPAGFSPRIIDTGDAGLSIPLFLEANTGKISLFDGTSNRVGTAPTFPLTSPAKIASAWGGSTTTLARAGTTTDGGGFDGNMNIATTIGIGNRSSGGAAGNEIFGTVKNIRIYQTQLSASQLQAVTA